MSSSEEIGDLVLAVFLAVVIGVAYLVVMLLLGTIRRRPLFSIGERPNIDSLEILYIGIAFFGGLALAAFLKGMMVVGVVHLLLMSVCVAALIAFRRGWRG
jgi:hypothetical protein